MNIEHFKAFLWLRWRIRINQLKKGGIGNAIVLGLLLVSLVVSAIGTFVSGLIVGGTVLGQVKSDVLMYVWDGVVVGFMFFWMIGLITELQRAESLSLDKFLHFPVSLRSAFLINYFSSLGGLSMLIFVPMIIGLSIGLTFSRGFWMILTLPAALSFLFAVSAITYQFQGWLASMMSNPRRRRTIIALFTFSFVLVAQLPNLINVIRPFGKLDEKFEKDVAERRNELTTNWQTGKTSPEEFVKLNKEFEETVQKQREERKTEFAQQAVSTAYYINAALPPGWFPLGVKYLAEDTPWVLLGSGVFFSACGLLSLWRAYRTTLKLYTGFFTSGVKATTGANVVKEPEKFDPSKVRLVEYRISWLPEPAVGIAFGTFRALTRAPEAKMLLMMPFIFCFIFGGLFFTRSEKIPEYLRPFTVVASIATILFSLQQLIANQFGYDRGGFRTFVLGPVARYQILLGKNLAVFPIVVAFSLFSIVAIEIMMPMRIDHLLVLLLQILPMFFGMCVIANMLSMFAPIPIPAGATKATNVKFLTVLLHMIATMMLPFAFLPGIFPLALEIGLEQLGAIPRIPLALVLQAVVFAASIYVYRWILQWQGALLQAREQKILEVVVSRSE